MASRVLRAALAVFVLLAQSAWAQPPKPVSTNGELAQVTRGSNQFGTELYGRLSAGDAANVVCSPSSIYTALAMTYGGAEGQTRQQMAEVLRFTLPPAKLHAAVAQLMLAAHSDSEQQGIELRVANRLWGQQGYHFLSAFLQLTREQYGAELAQVDFSGETENARQSINSWVAEQTGSEIPELIASRSLPSTTRLALTNAICFKGQWAHEFAKAATANAPFQTSPGKAVSVPMMFQETELLYVALEDMQVVELPYGKDAHFSMLVILPRKVDGLRILGMQLSIEKFDNWYGALRPHTVRLYLPRFKVASEFQLRTALEAMGMTQLFDPTRTNFSGISREEQLALSAVIHKASLQVHEQGTIATAATAVVAVPKAARDPKPQAAVFRADHPFVLVIRNNRTKSVLLMGQVTNPGE